LTAWIAVQQKVTRAAPTPPVEVRGTSLGSGRCRGAHVSGNVPPRPSRSAGDASPGGSAPGHSPRLGCVVGSGDAPFPPATSPAAGRVPRRLRPPLPGRGLVGLVGPMTARGMGNATSPHGAQGHGLRPRGLDSSPWWNTFHHGPPSRSAVSQVRLPATLPVDDTPRPPQLPLTPVFPSSVFLRCAFWPAVQSPLPGS